MSIRVVDRWRPEENTGLFPELEDVAFGMPDFVADLNTDRLKAVGDSSQDFVICSHVLEHLAEPIGLLDDMHRVLRRGGVLLILLPDRHRTFDRNRERTTVAHLVAEYEAGVTEVDDDHITDFLEGLPEEYESERRRFSYDVHRMRSIHVHCWDDQEFMDVLLYGVEHLGWRWEFVDGMVSDDQGEDGIEFGFVLRVCSADPTQAELRERLDRDWHVWREERLRLLVSTATARRRIVELEAEVTKANAAASGAQVAATSAEVAAGNLQARLERIDRSPPMRLYHWLKHVPRAR
jgi:SAM-dependent methyltransferase